VNYLEHGKQKALATASFFSAALIGSATVVLLVNQLADFPGFTIYGPGESWKLILVSCALLAWSLLLVFAGKTAYFRRKFIFYAAAPLLCMVCSHFILPEYLTTTRAPGAFLLSHAQRVTPETTLISDRRLTSAVCWFYKRDDVLLIDEGEFAYGLSCEDSQNRLLTIETFRKLFDEESGNKKIVLIIGKKLFEKSEHLFPEAAFKATSGDMVFVEFYNKAFG
jgi:4-amino-4-deoxy-L-arabinose transferase